MSLPRGGVQEVIAEGAEAPQPADEQDQGWYVKNNSYSCSLQPQKADSSQVEAYRFLLSPRRFSDPLEPLPAAARIPEGE